MPYEEPLDLLSVRCFLEASQSPSFRAAAKAMHLSPAAFGERIARLEAQLGVRLLERGRRISPSPAGVRFRPHAEALLGAEQRARRAQLSEQAPRPPFSIELGTRFELGLSWLVPALPHLSAAHPERRLHLQFADTRGLVERMHARSLDAFISSARMAFTDLAFAPLHDEGYAFVGAAQHLADQPLRRAEDARNHVLIDARSDLPLFQYFLDAAPPEPAWAFADHEYMGTIAAVRDRVRGGYGVAVLPRYYVELELESQTLLELLPEVRPRQDVFRLIWPQAHPLDAELRELAGELRALPLR